MSHSVFINKSSPAALIFVIDQSRSMADSLPVADQPQRKCDAAAAIANDAIWGLVMNCLRQEEVRDYFYVGVIGYGATVGPTWGEAFSNRELIPISELAASPAKIEVRNKTIPDGDGGLLQREVKYPIWIDPVCAGDAPMWQALKMAHRLTDEWIKGHPECFPPLVIHITGGGSTSSRDNDETKRITGEAMAELKTLHSIDGHLLLFNAYLSSNPNTRPVSFPSDPTDLEDDFARQLFDGSSELNEDMEFVGLNNDLPSLPAKLLSISTKLTPDILEFFQIATAPCRQMRRDKAMAAAATSLSTTQILPIKPNTMSYSAEISRTAPTLLIFVIDQSGSMADSISNSDPPLRKCDTVADIVNNRLRELSMRCVREEEVRDYYHVGVIGYGVTVGTAWGGVFANRELLPISGLAASPVKIEIRTKKDTDGAGGLVEKTVKFPVWFEPVANGGTPMSAALNTARRLADQWVKDHPDGFPPCVIHITDGESTDSKDRNEANRMVADAMAGLKSIRSADGNVLLFNIYLSSNQNARPVSLSSDATNLPDDYSRMLFEGSSVLTEKMKSVATKEHNLCVSDSSKCFALNADLELLFQCIDIGTRAANMR